MVSRHNAYFGNILPRNTSFDIRQQMKKMAKVMPVITTRGLDQRWGNEVESVPDCAHPTMEFNFILETFHSDIPDKNINIFLICELTFVL